MMAGAGCTSSRYSAITVISLMMRPSSSVTVRPAKALSAGSIAAPLAKGDAVIFAVNVRPVRGSRGDYRVAMRHGVSEIRSGARHTLGVIFHDAA